MTSDPLTPSPLSGPVDECAALRAEVERLPEREFAIGQALVNEQLRSERAERDLGEARAHLAEARQRIVERQDIIADWMNAAGDARRRAAAAEARLEAVQSLHGPERLSRVVVNSSGPYRLPAPRCTCGHDLPCPTAAALAVSPPEPEADDKFVHGQAEDGTKWRVRREPIFPVEPEADEVPRDRYRAERDEDGSLRAAPQPVDQPKCEHGEEQR